MCQFKTEHSWYQRLIFQWRRNGELFSCRTGFFGETNFYFTFAVRFLRKCEINSYFMIFFFFFSRQGGKINENFFSTHYHLEMYLLIHKILLHFISQRWKRGFFFFNFLVTFMDLRKRENMFLLYSMQENVEKTVFSYFVVVFSETRVNMG